MNKKALNTNCPLVSIVVLNYNGKAYLERCLQSVTSLIYRNYEVIVVDNGSSDGSPNIVKRDFKDVKLIINKTNLGFAKGNNIGIKASRGDLVVLLNNDVVVDSTWLSELVKATVNSPKIGMTSGIILQSKPSDVVWSAGKKIDAFTGISWRIGYGKKLERMGRTEDVDYFSACALLIKREVIGKIGLLDEGYFFYGEDADWALTARRAGYKCKLVKSAVVWHEGSATSRRASKKRYYWYNLGIFRLVFKHFPIGYLFAALFFQLTLLSVFEIFLFRSPAEYVLLKFDAFARNIANLRKIMTERMEIQCLGDSNLIRRLRECLDVAKARASSRYYDF